ncbi:UNVERIFIED_CONTAM: hypothetical protein K2H54_010966 [Gekko kuhli]
MQEEHLEAEIPLRLLSPNCQEWETHGIQEIELDLRSHQEQQAVTKRLEYTKNCLLARKKDERFKQQAIQDDNMVNSSANVLTQTPQVTKLLLSSEVEMDIEQEINGSSAANVDFLQTTKNGSVFMDRDRILDQINESE